MPLRILHVVNNLGQGGLENGLVNLIGQMDPRRFEHVVCAVRGLGPNADRLPRDRVTIENLADSRWNSRVQTPALVRAIRRFRPDIVHTRNWAGVEGVLAARLAMVGGVVHSEHGFDGGAASVEPRRRIWVRRIAYGLADRVLTVSFQLRHQLSARMAFPEDRITVVHNGVDRQRFYPDAALRAQARYRLGLQDGNVCIGCVANLLPVKDHMTLLQACAGLPPDDRRRVRLVCIGEGPERDRLQGFVQSRAELRERVLFLGSRPDIDDLLRAMDVFVLPSVSEGLSNALLEAMASGLPVLATAVGGNLEAVIDGDSGLLFPVGDADALGEHLHGLASDPQRRERIGSRALQRVREEFSMETMVSGYEQLYLGLVRPAAAPAFSA